MKKIFKLKVELGIFAIISLIISVILLGIIRDSKIINNKTDNEKINYIYNSQIKPLERQIKNIDLKTNIDNSSLDNLMYQKFGIAFYVVDKDGNVLLSNNMEAKKINSNEIKNGLRKIEPDNRNEVISKISFCDYINNGYYLYAVYLGYTTSEFPTEICLLIIFIVIFTLLSLGRIKYIGAIKRGIGIIRKGGLSYKIPLKYKNELRALAEDINKMAEELKNEDEKRREFLTNISHDIRTPLTSIIGYLTMIKEKKYEDKKELDGYIDKVDRKSLFLKSMLDDFFQYSKLSSGDIKLVKEQINIQELIRQLIEEEELVFRENKLKLVSMLDNNKLNMLGDGELIVRAISNLLSNALKYSKKNTVVNVKLFQEVIDEQTYAVISINSTPAEIISQIEAKKFFQRLYKKDKSRSKSGSGLGLAIVQEILKLHHGFVDVHTENNEIIFKLFFII